VRLTARARLTLLYTALISTGGAILVVATYLLVAHSLHTSKGVSVVDQNFVAQCAKVEQDTSPETANLRAKCATVFQLGVNAGARAQRALTLNHLLTYSLLTLAGVIALAALGGWLLAGRILRPVHQLTAAARAASEHNLSHRLALSGPRDELRELADTFDDMLARLDAAFTSQSRFIANASHEMRTPLTVMRTTLDVVLSQPDPTRAELIAMGADLRRAVDHAETLINSLLTLARNERGLTVHDRVDLATVAEDVLDTIALDGLSVSAGLEPAHVTGDPRLLERLVANLVDNAMRYNVAGGRVGVTTSARNGWVELQVTNTGPVVPPDQVERLFQPFTRLDQRTGDGVGLGLGLALVASITAVHHATVSATAPSTGGLDVTVRLPATSPLA
jgi:signal transduction histidine kinase